MLFAVCQQLFSFFYFSFFSGIFVDITQHRTKKVTAPWGLSLIGALIYHVLPGMSSKFVLFFRTIFPAFYQSQDTTFFPCFIYILWLSSKSPHFFFYLFLWSFYKNCVLQSYNLIPGPKRFSALGSFFTACPLPGPE